MLVGSTYGQRGITTTQVFYPYDGDTFAVGTIFNVTAKVGCTEALCKHFVVIGSVQPEGGLVYNGLNATHYQGDVGMSTTKIQYWIYEASVPGTYTIKVETTSTTAETSMKEIRVNIVSEDGEQPPAMPTVQPTASATLPAGPTAYAPTAAPSQPPAQEQQQQPLSPIFLLVGLVVLAGIVYYVYTSQQKGGKK